MDIKNLFRDSYDSLSGKWGKAIGGALIYFSIPFGLSIIVGVIALIIQLSLNLSELEGNFLSQLLSYPISILINPPLLVGFIIFCLNISRNSEAEISDLFLGFKKQWLKYILAYLLLGFLVLVGFILFIIPGIIATLMFSQVFYILAEDDDIGVVEAFQKSASMMKGYNTSKLYSNYMYFFGIGCVFAVLFILALFIGMLTCGIGFVGFIFIIPPFNRFFFNIFHKIF